jgi:aldose 1-epimerase
VEEKAFMQQVAFVFGCLLVGALAMVPVGAEGAAKAGVSKKVFGKLADDTVVDIYTLTNANGLSASVMTYGATLTELHVPDKNGQFGDVVLGFDNLEQYVKGHPYFGSTVGRVANRIAGGKFTLDGKRYNLAINNAPNHLHGGLKAFDKVVWKASRVRRSAGPAVRFTYHSPDGEEGYPGNLDVTVVYTLTNQNGLRIEYAARTDRDAPVNLTNHTYFNLVGKEDVLSHQMLLVADRYVPVDATLIPTGELKAVKGTPMDFTAPHAIGERINEVGGDPKGYDHCYVLNSGGRSFALGARVSEPTSGRVLEMETTEPGVQFYTGNFLDGSLTGKGGTVYRQYAGFCLEAGHFPDSVHHSNFPSIILRPGQTYRQRTEYRFSTR